ncbi:hypothetical protein [Helcobacillus massiliensis]|uniref:Uncharacterized protein n=1 Tax=Helcobacillus massiliensis TaxID=521392 RepID=A0A839QU55_9MICO|nr:hypothetical protein [Helcobacillus massiliensis]MBB3023834.1 hypothetical protein [Helcobacillus massiliensis]
MAAPAYAGSPQPPKRSGDYGLFVTASAEGERMGNINTTSVLADYTAADTPGESFRNGSTWVEPDKNWDDATGRPISPTPPYHNGEGSYTPAGNAGGSNGSYAASTGFWFSSPTKTPGTGTGYTGTATLQPGAVFSSRITIVAMPGGTHPVRDEQDAGVDRQLHPEAHRRNQPLQPLHGEIAGRRHARPEAGH